MTAKNAQLAVFNKSMKNCLATLTAAAWLTETKKTKDVQKMDNGELAGMAATNGAAPQGTELAACYAKACRWNRNGYCAFNGVEIGAAGGCMHYEEQTEEQLRRYLAGRGLTMEQVEQVLQEAKNGGLD